MAVFPCGVCKLECTGDCIECSSCQYWIHRACVPMSDKVFQSWKPEQLSFQCPRCIFGGVQESWVAFDCAGALSRIHRAVNSGKDFFWALHSERLLLETYGVSLPDVQPGSNGDGNTCQSATAILQLMCPTVLTERRPLQVNGDGNCFYRAVSRALYGNESYHLLLRLLIVLEIGENPRYYDHGKRSKIDLIDDVRIVVSSWRALLLATASVGGYSEMMHFYAASAVLRLALHSYCPPSKNHYALSEPFTRIVRGRGVGKSRTPDHMIMWSMMNPPADFGSFIPNHFVVLAVKGSQEYVDLTKGDYPPLQSHSPPASLTPPAIKPARKKALAKQASPTKMSVDKRANDNGSDPLTVKSATKEKKILRGRLSLKKADDNGSDTLPAKSAVDEKASLIIGGSVPFTTLLSPVKANSSKDEHSVASFHHFASTPRNKICDATYTVAHVDDHVGEDVDNLSILTAFQSSFIHDIDFDVRCDGSGVLDMQISEDDNVDGMHSQSVIGSKVQNVGQNNSARGVDSTHSQSVTGSEDQQEVTQRAEANDSVEGCLPAEGGHALPKANDFMDVHEAISRIAECSSPLPCIPDGKKESVFFLVSNARNKARLDKGLMAEYCDDCGAWTAGSSKNYFYMKTGDGLSAVAFKDGVYCKQGRSKKEQGRKMVLIPVQPQPQNKDVVTVRRYYCSLKGSTSYKRRITSVDGHSVVCVEYIGEYPVQRRSHGLARVLSGPYIRTKGEVLERIGDDCRNLNPRSVYQNMKLEGQFSDIPKDLKQVNNKKTYERTKMKSAGSLAKGKGLADAIVHLVNRMHEDSFVKQVVHTKCKVPAIVLYTEDQLKDVKRFCCRGAGFRNTVLGVDKTYNLGELHVTITVFKHLGLVRKDSGNHPIFLGPVLLHGNSDVATFATFFSKLNIDLGSREADPVFGTDAEIALRQGISKAFPSASLVSCVRHLKSNVIDYLRNKVGCAEHVRRRVVDAIFGVFENSQASGGLLHAKSAVQYEILCQEVEVLIQASVPGFLTYFLGTVKPVLDQNHKCVLNHSVEPGWTNNNCESMNFILKLGNNWRSQPIDKLVQSIRDVVRGLYVDAERAIVGTGEFRLVLSLVSSLQRDRNVWAKKTQEQRNLHWNKFMNFCISATGGAVSTTTDGQLTVLRSASAGKKPGQRKRKRCAKTTTIPPAKRTLFGLSTVLEASE